jgi:hypothetical protein
MAGPNNPAVYCALVQGQRSREQIALRARGLVVVREPERESVLNERIFGERMRRLGRREFFAFPPQPIAELNDLLGKIDWPEVVVFAFERLLKRCWLSNNIAIIL